MSDADFTSQTPAPPATIGIGVIGLGFMGCTHVRAYQAAAATGISCRLAAVADRSAERLGGRAVLGGNLGQDAGEQIFDPRSVRGYTDPRELLTDADVHAVSICTHTDTHVDLGVAALRAGKHVLVEKPVALSAAEVSRLAGVAKETGRVCMPAMCMRFWPGWVWLREAIRAGALGKVLSATFQRLGTPPSWADFYRDVSRSGGALFDLHIHDADFVRWCFGEPREVVSAGSVDHVTTMYRFEGGPGHVVAEGGHDGAPGFGFRMRYLVAFERATADFDFGRTPRLLVHRDGRSEVVAEAGEDALSAYDAEVRAFLGAIAAGRGGEGMVATMDDAVRTARLLEAESASLKSGLAVRVA